MVPFEFTYHTIQLQELKTPTLLPLSRSQWILDRTRENDLLYRIGNFLMFFDVRIEDSQITTIGFI